MESKYEVINLNEILTHLADELDVSPAKYREATERYQAVGEWLGRDESAFAGRDVRIYPQGSFAIGTATKPIGEGDYDVDAVFSCSLTKREITQQQFKNAVGSRLRQHATYKSMLQPPDGGRRCWTLVYADTSKFHLDILPAIPDDPRWLIGHGIPASLAQHTVCITDRDSWSNGHDWPKSNPGGFAMWFRTRMQPAFDKERLALAEARKAEIQQVPDYEVRTPLQRTIQLLKRHRDLLYPTDNDKPASIVVTTLAAQAYSGEATVIDALRAILPKMRSLVETRGNVLWIANPVNPFENFADRWTAKPRQAKIFFEWLDKVGQLQDELAAATGLSRLTEKIGAAYGSRETNTVVEKLGRNVRANRESGNLFMETTTGSLNTIGIGTQVRRHTFFGS